MFFTKMSKKILDNKFSISYNNFMEGLPQALFFTPPWKGFHEQRKRG